jgi:hypothetical protein
MKQPQCRECFHGEIPVLRKLALPDPVASPSFFRSSEPQAPPRTVSAAMLTRSASTSHVPLWALVATALLACLLCSKETAGAPLYYILPLPTDDFCRSYFARELGGCPPTSHDLVKALPRQPGDKH